MALQDVPEGRGHPHWFRFGFFTRLLEGTLFSPLPSLFRFLQCEGAHRTQVSLASGCSSQFGQRQHEMWGCPQLVQKCCFPASFPVPCLRAHGAGHPVSHPSPGHTSMPGSAGGDLSSSKFPLMSCAWVVSELCA